MQQEEVPSGAPRNVEVGLWRPLLLLAPGKDLLGSGTCVHPDDDRLTVPYPLCFIFGCRPQISEEGIAWPTDKKYLFGDVPAVNYNINASLRGGNTTEQLLSESEHLMVWFRTSSKPTIVYRWGTIEQDLEPGSYKLKVRGRASPLPLPPRLFCPGSHSECKRQRTQ